MTSELFFNSAALDFEEKNRIPHGGTTLRCPFRRKTLTKLA